MTTARRAGVLIALASLGSLFSNATIAGPSDYVLTTTVEQGEKEIDFKAGSAKLRDGARETKESIGLGYGATAWWFTEVYAIWHKLPGEPHGFDAWEWENKFALTEPGKYPVDLGLILEIERPKDRSEGYELKWGPLLQTDLSANIQANLNILFQKNVRAAQSAEASMGYQWQLKYRWRPELEIGMQGFGDVGAWNDWAGTAQQSHIAGPALFGRVRVADRQSITYNAALLFGVGAGSPRDTFRLQAEYEF